MAAIHSARRAESTMVQLITPNGTGSELSIAPNGRIDVVWFDTRNASNNVGFAAFPFLQDRSRKHLVGPTLSEGWTIAGVADFDGDSRPDLQGVQRECACTIHRVIGGASAPTIAAKYDLTGLADFDGNGRPDYLLYDASTRQTAIWHLNKQSAHRHSKRSNSSSWLESGRTLTQRSGEWSPRRLFQESRDPRTDDRRPRFLSLYFANSMNSTNETLGGRHLC